MPNGPSFGSPARQSCLRLPEFRRLWLPETRDVRSSSQGDMRGDGAKHILQTRCCNDGGPVHTKAQACGTEARA